MGYIKTTPTPYSVAQFIRWYREGSLDLSPDFQRRSVWKPLAKAYFIDTLLRGFPVPPLYLRNMKTNQKTLKTPKQVVDGQQRLRTVIAFVDPTALTDRDDASELFTLSDAHNDSHKNKHFADLTSEERQQILDYDFTVHTFDTQTSDATVLQIFARMNSTGVKANRQELRNAEYFGHFKTVAYRLAEEQFRRWIDWRVLTPSQIARMEEVELTSDLLGLILGGVSAKTPKILDTLYKKYDAQFKEKIECTRRFRYVFDRLDDLKPSSGLGALRERTLFYAGFAVVYDKCFRLESPLKRTKPRRITRAQIGRLVGAANRINAGNVPVAVQNASTVRVTHASARRTLIRFLDDECG